MVAVLSWYGCCKSVCLKTHLDIWHIIRKDRLLTVPRNNPDVKMHRSTGIRKPKLHKLYILKAVRMILTPSPLQDLFIYQLKQQSPEA